MSVGSAFIEEKRSTVSKKTQLSAGVGERIAEDRGGRIKGKVLDLFLPSIEHCRQFGVRLHDVQIVLE
jgi:3D (Asp-Asp-Asp) domain-containing protein